MPEIPRHPMQPLVLDENGTLRFKANAIVRALLDRDTERHQYDAGGILPASSGGLNWIATQNFPQEDYEQLCQLIGYSVSGYHELSDVSDASALEASAKAKKTLAGAGGCRDADSGCAIHSGVAREEPSGTRRKRG